MKIKIKLSIVVIAIMAVVVTGITSLLLWQASKNSLQLSLRAGAFGQQPRGILERPGGRLYPGVDNSGKYTGGL